MEWWAWTLVALGAVAALVFAYSAGYAADRCDHRREDGKRSYIGPRAFEMGPGIGPPGPEYYHAMYGVTVIAQKCSECGGRRSIKRQGDHRD
jgi:hypothetical protein